MSAPSDCRDPEKSDPSPDPVPAQEVDDHSAAATPVQTGSEPSAAAAAPCVVTSPEQQSSTETAAKAPVKEEPAEAVIQEGSVETAVQEEAEEAVVQEVAEEVAQEVAEVVAQEEATPIRNDQDQQGHVEHADDMLEPVDELPLDDELVEMLPTVVEDPENEAREQKALLEESVEEVAEGGEQGQLANAKNKPQELLSEDFGSVNEENVEHAKSTAEPGPVGGTQKDAAKSESDQPEAELNEAENVKQEAVTADVTSEADAEPITTAPETTEETVKLVKAIEEPAESTKSTEEFVDVEEPADPAKTPEQSADTEKTADAYAETYQQPAAHDEEKQSQMTEVPGAGESREPTVPSEGDVQASKPTTEPEEGANETGEEDKKEKKKRKKSKEERKKKKSVEEQEHTQEEKSSKPALLHVRGGFSCGWVGPMLQLLGTMKKLDEFKECHGKRYTPKGQEYGQRPDIPETASEPPEEAAPGQAPDIPEAAIRAPPGEGCPRCGGAVFEAERMKSRFRSYHKPCFNCKACHRILDSTLACDGPDKDVYCKLCYAKKYGPKGYGFGGGKAFLQSDIISAESPQSKPEWVKLDRTTIKPTEGSGCPRCGGAVFAAELMMSKGQEWHISCFGCRDCKRPLDSTIACDGPDKEIYCKVDYAKRFGPKGFGFGHGPTLVSFVHDEDQDQSQTSGQATAPTMGSKAAPGEGCPRCGFAVYAAETMLHNGKAYHRHCFSCGECNRSLDSTNTCCGPEGQLLCSSCYGKLFGPHGVGYGQGAGVLSMG